ncbi:galactokinase [Corynebacterium testudinoris]|uniref:Galactokinase n=1 Tax=Corynebacterium testudinoris TaxID=136857 RepID=A0A0G3HBG8_9CORY|nr:galactokinase family protein [Corynebacterium testudinoris]AKK09288.1 galactokinase [Corynebacterium testudinoris]MBX8995928.1 galactokinase [Corynebacterium testudinoris]
MPIWPSAHSPVLDRVRQLHREETGVESTQVADAPGTWLVMGEHVDYAGGVTLIAQVSQRVAVAVSPRPDDLIKVTYQSTALDGVVTTTGEITLATVEERATTQQLVDVDSSIAARLGGIVWTMIHRQLLSRDTAGMDVTVVSDIPADAGLGAISSAEAAFALALLGEVEDRDEAPLRARLAEVCAQAADIFSHTPSLRSRYTAILRGAAGQVAVVNYADGSVTQAPHPISANMRILAVIGPETEVDQTVAIQERRRFLDAACRAFGTESLRLLPDAPTRVLDWLRAVHKVHGTDGQPSLEQATTWLTFDKEETARAEQLSRSLRSRRIEDLWDLMSESQAGLEDYGLDAQSDLAQLVLVRGAAGARAAVAGMSAAVIAGVDKRHADNFVADLSADGFTIVDVGTGSPAQVD